jgi:hypothetical protein
MVTGVDNDNYILAQGAVTTQDFNIVKEIDAELNVEDMVYGESDTTKSVSYGSRPSIQISEADYDVVYYYRPVRSDAWLPWKSISSAPAGNYQAKAVVTDPTGETNVKVGITSFEITPRPLTIRALDKWIKYGDTIDAAQDLKVTVSGLTAADEANKDNVLKVTASVDTTVEQPYPADTYDIVPSVDWYGGHAGNYEVEAVNGKLYVKAASDNDVELDIADYDYTYGDTVEKPAKANGRVSATFGNPVVVWLPYDEYAVDPDNNTTWNAWNKDSQPTEAGVYAVKAYVDAAADGSYPAGQAIDFFTIEKKDATVAIKDASSVFNGEEVKPLAEAVEVTVTGEVKEGDIKYELSSDPATIKNVGFYNVTATVKENKNYNVTVEDGTYEVTPATSLTAEVEYFNTDGKDNGHCVFNGQRHGIKVTAKDGDATLTPPAATVYYSLTELDSPEGGVTNPELVAPIHAGKYTIWYYIDAENYAPVKGSKVVDIDKAYLRLTIFDKEVTYGTRLDYVDIDKPLDELVDKGYVDLKAYKERGEQTKLDVIEEVIDGLNSFRLTMGDGYTDEMSDVGTYKITSSKLESDDYNIRYTEGMLTVVAKAITFSWDYENNHEFLYDGKEHGVKAVINKDDLVGTDKREGQVDIVYEDNNKFPSTAVDVRRVKDGEDEWAVGTYTAKVQSLKGDRAHNYKIDWNDNGKVNFRWNYKIVPVDLTLIPNDVTVVYGEDAKDNGYTATGLVNDEKAEDVVLGTPVKYEFVNYEKGSDVGSYDIRITNIEDPNTKETLHAQNYTLKAEVNEDGLNVVQREITLVWSTPKSFEYDGQYHEVKVVKATNDYADNSALDPAPTYTDNKKVNAGSYKATAKLSAADAKNYRILDGTEEYAWEITKRPATIYANANSIVYGQAPAANGYYIDRKPLVKNVETGKLDNLGDVSFTFDYKTNGKPGVYNIIPVVRNLNPNYTIAGTVYGKLTVDYVNLDLLAQGKTSGNKAVRISWNNVTGAASYDVYISKCNIGKKKYTPKRVGSTKGTSLRVKKLKKNRCYKFYVVAKDANGVRIAKSKMGHVATGNVAGKYTNAKKLTVGAKTVVLSRGSSSKISSTLKKAKSNKKLLDQGHGALRRYFSNNPSVATVSSTGVITGLTEGWCKVYVQSLNGLWQEIEVYVK